MANTWTTLLDAVYPVGSVYISYNTTSPATLFGGTWSAITGFPWLHGTTTPGTTGGEQEHTLSISEMPSHSHNWGTNWGWDVSQGTASGNYSVPKEDNYWYNAMMNSSNFIGGSQPHNNLPPYYVLRGWRRTA